MIAIMIDGYNITVFAKEMTNMLKTFFPCSPYCGEQQCYVETGNMDYSKSQKISRSGLLLSFLVKIVLILGIYYFCTFLNLPIGLTASFILFAFFMYLTLSSYKSLDKHKKVYFIGMTIAAFILLTLFGYNHFISEIRITALHIGVIILIPFFLWKILEKKAKDG
jgi:hypothetical protein